MTDGVPILSVRNLECYHGPVTALRGVSLNVRSGSIVCVLGANGAGKTSLLRAISGVLAAGKGAIEFQGSSIAGHSCDKIVRAGIVHVPEGREIFPLLSVDDNLSMGAYTRRDRDAIAADRDLVFGYFPILRERRAQHAALLSGGQQQMLAIGRALMARPRLLLLDEPSLGLSPRLAEEIFTIIGRLNRERGLTILLVEQNARLALDLAGEGYVLELGRIVLEGDAARLRASSDVQESYLATAEDGAARQRRWKQRKTWR